MVKILLALVLSVTLFVGCGTTTSPDDVVNDYWELFKEGNTEAAFDLVVDGREDEVKDMDMNIEEIEEAEDVLWERFTVEPESYEEKDEVAVVDVTVTKPNLQETMGAFFAEGFEELMAMAFEGASEEEINERAEELFLDAIQDASDISHEEQVELHLENGEWKIYEWRFDNIEERLEEMEERDHMEEDHQSGESGEDEQVTAANAEVGDTITTDAGDMTLIARNNNIDKIETGPFDLNIKQVNAVSGDLSQDAIEMLDREELEYVQIDMNVENTSDDDLIFYAGQAQIATNTGEQLEADMMMSDHIQGEFMGGVSQEGTLIYPLKNSTAEEIETVRIVISAPQNEDWEDIGEEVDIEVEL